MKIKIYISVVFILLASLLKSQSDSIECVNSFSPLWAKTGGSALVDEAKDVCADEFGNIIVVGNFHQTLNLQSQTAISNGASDFFIAKFDQLGNLIWLKSGGGNQDDFANSVSVDSEGRINVIGNFKSASNFGGNIINSGGDSDIFLIQYSADGDYLWGKFPTGFNQDSGESVCVDSHDNIIITGYYDAYLGIGNGTLIAKGGKDFFIAKYDKNGNFIWRVNHGSNLDDIATSISCDINDNIFISGEFAGNINFGTTSLAANGNLNTFLAKYNKTGNFQWAKSFGNSENNASHAYNTCDNYGNSYIFYKSEQANNMAKIHKFNDEGIEIFNKNFGGIGNINPKAIKIDPSQNIFLAGNFSGLTNFGDANLNSIADSDYFVSKFDNNGNFKYKHIIGSSNSNSANAICINNLNNLIAAGHFSNSIFVNSNSYTSSGENDILMVKYEANFSFKEINISSNNCDPNDMCIDIEVINGLAPYNFYCDNVLIPPNICGLSIGTHEIIAVDANNCFIKTNIELNPLQGPQITLPANTSICPFSSATLDAGNGNFSYLWNNYQTSSSIEVSETGNYSVTVTDLGTGCSASASTNVIQIPNPDLLAETDSLCFGEELSITTFQTYSYYLWSNGTANQYFTSGEGGYHWVRVYDALSQCYFYDTIMFVYYPKIEINLGNDIVICDGDSVMISAPTNFIAYLWNDGSTSSSIWLSQAGNFELTVTDNNGCTASDNINVNIGLSPIIDLGEDFSICTNQNIILNPNAEQENLTYLWSDNSSDERLSINESGTYWVKVSEESGCAAYDTIIVTIYPEAVLNLGPDIEFCYGDSYFFELEDIYQTYQWSNGESSNSILVSNTQTLILSVTDSNNCQAKDSINFIEHDLIEPFMGYDTTFCEGENHILRLNKDYFKYLWQNGSTNATFSVKKAGNYAVTVYDNIGCSGSTEINVNFAEAPVWHDYSSGGGIIEVFASGGSPEYTYSYDGDTWQNSNQFTGLPAGLYTISIMDKNYCIISKEIYLDESLKIPNFFTPNGDGYNETWEITGLYHYPDAIVEVFDRFGKKLYISKGANFIWDGNYAGSALPSDTYWYVITLDTNKKNVLKGNVTIRR